ncbi:class II glutamine amidotransferase domain-containing protein [Methylohalomonas lacus]|nr:amidophosphoribosyltransferase [Methylohalomonas lacus]
MCGIVGLFIKNPAMEANLGNWLSDMLIEMTDRGPDSAGIAIYRNPVAANQTKITLLSRDEDIDWKKLGEQLKKDLHAAFEIEPVLNHAIVTTDANADDIKTWLEQNRPEILVNASGKVIEAYKQIGLPENLIERFNVRKMQGTHALGHSRMATESNVTTEHSHPFATGEDLCLVHNGSLSNHNRLRTFLRDQKIKFQTDNDSEVAAGYLTWRLREGDSLEQALEAAMKDLDGFYTFAIGTQDGFAVLRDPIGCKPAVMAETDDWAAMASEFRAIECLPGAESAKIWEPEPSRIYSWQRD